MSQAKVLYLLIGVGAVLIIIVLLRSGVGPTQQGVPTGSELADSQTGWPQAPQSSAHSVESDQAVRIEQVANFGTPVSTSTAERLGWPDGVLDVLNDPSRRDGWNTMAAESANDLHRYELWIESTEELQNLVDRFSKIQSNRLKVALETGIHVVFGARGGRANIVFSIGSQKLVDHWFTNLPARSPGFDKPPTAAPPTMAICMGNQLFDFDRLKIPVNIDVVDNRQKPKPREGKAQPPNAPDK
jgi:hypothetical protein